MSDIDSIGDAVTGAMLAGAVEPRTGVSDEPADGACLNCKAPLTGPYCHRCGQKAQVHRSLRGFFADFASGLFNFEGKIWRTIPLLAWHPGELTRRYIDGERARFVSPVALYLFTVFLMFAVLGFTGSITSNNVSLGNPLDVAAKDDRSALVRLERKRAKALAEHADISKFDRQIARKKQDLADLDRMGSSQLVVTNPGEMDKLPPWLARAIKRVQADPKAASRNVQDATSKFSWLLIPLSIPFLWLLFPFSRRFRMYDHSVFVTYSLSFMMILVITGGLLVALGSPGIASILALLPPFHMYRQLKGTYGLAWYSALLRTIALVSFAFVAGVLFAIAMVAIGIL
ncbi:MAG: DUF3667 domain-containing protein [Sphingomicrobium sp.]